MEKRFKEVHSREATHVVIPLGNGIEEGLKNQAFVEESTPSEPSPSPVSEEEIENTISPFIYPVEYRKIVAKAIIELIEKRETK